MSIAKRVIEYFQLHPQALAADAVRALGIKRRTVNNIISRHKLPHGKIVTISQQVIKYFQRCPDATVADAARHLKANRKTVDDVVDNYELTHRRVRRVRNSQRLSRQRPIVLERAVEGDLLIWVERFIAFCHKRNVPVVEARIMAMREFMAKHKSSDLILYAHVSSPGATTQMKELFKSVFEEVPE